MLGQADVQVLRKRRLDGTIDGHDPLVVNFRIRGSEWFRLTVVTVNLGRGYTAEQFRRNVARVIDAVDEKQYVVILFQEIDEVDPSPEHALIKAALFEAFGRSAVHLVQWGTREPIAVIGDDLTVSHERRTMTMDQGSTIGADGLGPRRFFVSCIVTMKGVRLGFGNQHPHRYSQRGRRGVGKMLAGGERIVRRVLGALCRVCDIVFDGGDLNTPNYPRSEPRQKIAYHVGLDYIRYTISNRRGARR